MAFVARPVITISYTFRDNDGKQSTVKFSIPGVVSPAGAVSLANSVRPMLAALSNAVIVRQNVLIGSHESTLATAPSSDVEDKGVFVFKASNGQKHSVAIPSYVETFLQPNNQDISLAYSEPGDFVDAMRALFTNAAGSPLNIYQRGYKQNRRSHIKGGRTRKG
jgi:hypothetical protein